MNPRPLRPHGNSTAQLLQIAKLQQTKHNVESVQHQGIKCARIKSKFRMDLPPESRFDKFRQDYRNVAQFAQIMQEMSTTLIVNCRTESGTFDNVTNMKSVTGMAATNGTNLQLLQKVNCNRKHLLCRNCDYLTAFYFPSDLPWVKLNIGGQTTGFYTGSSTGKPLDEILAEARVLPEQSENLELLLELSRQGKIGFVHKQEEQIHLDGIIYDRYILLHPFIPLIGLHYHEVQIECSAPCSFYIEVNNLEGPNRHALASTESLFLYADRQELPIVQITGGLGGVKYMGNPSADQEFHPEDLMDMLYPEHLYPSAHKQAYGISHNFSPMETPAIASAGIGFNSFY